MRLTSRKVVFIIIYTVLFCTYIFPTGIIEEGNYTISKFIFAFVVGSLYFLSILSSNQVNKYELFFNLTIVIIAVITRNVNYLLFITLSYLEKIIKFKREIIDNLNRSNILYICLFFTIVYSLCFTGSDDSRGRLAFTAIKEINQSGLAIFCLGCMLLTKNRVVGIFTLLFGCLTFSRSYFLALLCLIVLRNFGKGKKSFKKVISFLTYTKITFVSSILLIFLGIFYINQYKLGNIVLSSNTTNRLVSFLDYSNFFRFQAIIILIMILRDNFFDVLFGMSNDFYLEIGSKMSSGMGLPFRGTPPHNLFFSHLKIYGIFSIIETIYISRILSKIVNYRNFGIYIGIVLYSIFLGAGLYTYWLYLTVFTMIYYEESFNFN